MKKNSNQYKNIKIITEIITILVIIVYGAYIVERDVSDNNSVITINNAISYELNNIPEYSGQPFVIINNNISSFDDSYFTEESFENYSDLDKLGRCGTAFANLSKETMPQHEEKRTSISHIYPSGWKNKEYNRNLVDGGYLYNRCHLIAYSLSAENANEKNLITGTRYLNTNGMLPFETKVMNYLKDNPNMHVLYRVTPIFQDNNLLASGVIMEAQSVEDKGESICFCVYIYNVQPGIEIDYVTGDNKILE